MSKSRKSSANQTGDEANLGGGDHQVTPQGGRSQETPRGGADEAPRVEESMVLDFLQQLGTKMDAITSRVTRVEKRTARANAKRKLRRMKMSQNPRRNTIPPRRLINDFDEEAGPRGGGSARRGATRMG